MMSFFIHALVSFFAVMNPIGNVPIFLALTAEYTVEEQRRTAWKAISIAFIILTVFLLLGHVIFSLFGISINAFRLAGGILIFGIAYNLLHAKQSSVQSLHSHEHDESMEKEDISVTPLAIPIIAGPGTIATVMSLAAGPDLLTDSISVFIAYVIVLLVTYYIFYYSSWINKRLGQTEMNVVTRLMGLILAIIAVQMAAEGLGGLFPGLLH
jgi:multiple antibiotic resistance protein